MALARPSLESLNARAQSDLATRIEGASPLLRRSFLGTLAVAIAGAAHGLYGYLVEIARQVTPATATGNDLDGLASLYSIARKPASRAEGSVVATGAAGAGIEASTALVNRAGVQYFTLADAVIGLDGTATLALQADERGADANLPAASTLDFINPPIGIDTTATVDATGLNGGADVESDDQVRARLVARLASAPHGGNAADYEAWALAVEGVDRAWCLPCYAGPGSVRVYIGDDDFTTGPRIASDATVIRVRQAIEAVMPVGVCVLDGGGLPVSGLSVVAPTKKLVNLTASVLPDTAAVKAAVAANLAILFARTSPEGTVRIKQLLKAFLDADGLEDFELVSPTVDQVAGESEILRLGTLTWV